MTALNDPLSERVLILAPHGRDAPVALALLADAGLRALIVPDLSVLRRGLVEGAGAALVTEEAVRSADLAPIGGWLAEQPAWSDMPFILLTRQGGGTDRNPAAARLSKVLGNVSFLERPFHPTTLISIAVAALRGRRRQYEARTRLNALRSGEERLHFALEAGGMGTWELDLRSLELTASDHCRTNFGFTSGSTFTYVDLRSVIHPEDRERQAAAVRDAVAGCRDYEIEYRVLHPETGEIRWVAIRGRPTYGIDGTPLLMAGVSADITQRKLAEQALREFSETLERRVEDEVAERTKAEDALRQAQKMEAVGQLTGGVAHDFNNLLTIIRSSVDFLRRPDLPDERRRRYLEAVSDTVDRAAKLTGQLLAFARRQALKPETFEVGACLRGVAEMLDTVTGARIHVNLEVPESRCFVCCDRSQFETALVNMAVNARDAMNGEGALVLRLVSDQPMPAIRGHAGSSAAFAAVALTDTGTGIGPADLARIFEPFFTTKEVGKGTGLGLSQVFGFAKQSGGDVDVVSAPRQGTTFTIYLPQVGAPAEDDAPPPSLTGDTDGAGRRVLVVEDNVEVGRFATQILQDLGYMTEWAANAEAALERLGPDGDGFDAVFSDVVMPGMGGIALAEDLRRRLPDLPVVLASGYSHVLAEEGTHGFELLHKPYSADQLSRVLRRVIARAV